MTGYAELHCLTPFSFLRGASTARELFERAKTQGYSALAITDPKRRTRPTPPIHRGCSPVRVRCGCCRAPCHCAITL